MYRIRLLKNIREINSMVCIVQPMEMYT